MISLYKNQGFPRAREINRRSQGAALHLQRFAVARFALDPQHQQRPAQTLELRFIFHQLSAATGGLEALGC